MNNIILLDSRMRNNEIRLTTLKFELGFNIKNETEQPLYIEVKRKSGFMVPDESDIEELIIHSEKPND